MKHALLVAALVLTGCSLGVRNSTGGASGSHTAAAELASLGSWLLWAGGFGLALGLIGKLATATPALAFLRLTPLAGIVGLLAEAAAVCLALGLACLFFAQHFWLLVASGVLAGLAWAFRYRARIGQWFRIGSRPVRPSLSDLKE